MVSRIGKMLIFLSSMLLTAMTFNSAAQNQKINVLSSNNNQQNSVDYFRLILVAALEATEDKYGKFELVDRNLPYSQERSLEFLNDPDGLDVMHTMTNSERESKYIPVKVPLLKGLIGYRMLLTNLDNVDKLNKVNNLKDLQKLIACQGAHWPDSDILEHNQLVVARVLIFEAMYDMVSRGRCDYFPRGILEIYSEFDAFAKNHKNLVIVPDLMLQYRAPMYFFVGKRNPELAARLTDGLSQLISSGELDTLLKSSPMSKEVFPLSKWQDARIIKLATPELTVDEKAELWFQLGNSK